MYFCACVVKLLSRVWFKVVNITHWIVNIVWSYLMTTKYGYWFTQFSKSVFANKKEKHEIPEIQLRDHGSDLLGFKNKCFPLLVLLFLFEDLSSFQVEKLALRCWNNNSCCAIQGSDEETMNLLCVSNLLSTLNVHVKIVFANSNSQRQCLWSFLGKCSGSCVGYVWYDSRRHHVYEIVGEKLHVLTSEKKLFSKPSVF